MAYNVKNSHFDKELDFTPTEMRFLLELSASLKTAKYGGGRQMTEHTNMPDSLEVTDEVFDRLPASCSIKPRTGCTPSRPSWWRRWPRNRMGITSGNYRW